MADFKLSEYQEKIQDFFLTHPHDNMLVNALAGCVDCDTEFLSEKGWKKISDYQVGDKVLQYSYDGTANFVEPERYIKLPCDFLWHFKTKYGVNQCLSEEHEVYYINDSDKGRLDHIPFSEMKRRHENCGVGFTGRFVSAFNYDGEGIPLTDNEIKIMCAVICDGSFYSQATEDWDSYYTCRFHVKKDRKKEALRSLFKEGGLSWREAKSATEGYTDFYITAPRREKEFSSYWYNCSNHQLQIICENLIQWDGGYESLIKTGRISFSTTIKSTADFVQFAFNACGKKATIGVNDSRGRIKITYGKECERKNIDYTVIVTNKRSNTCGISRRTDLGKEKVPITPYKTLDGFKYCFTVPSGIWVMRRGNCVCVTGNSGKSSTACLLLEQVTQPSVYLAFNNSVVEEFKKRIKNPKVKIYTTHSIGYGIMLSNMENKEDAGGFGKRGATNVTLDNLKIYKIVEEYIEKHESVSFPEMLFLKDGYVSLYNLARMTMADISNPIDIERLIKGHGLFIDFEHDYKAPSKEAATKAIQYINKRDWEIFEKNSTIDFGGMLYITYWKLKNGEWKVPFYDLFFNVLADEVQDFSNLQQAFLPFLKRKGGRFVLIGDSRQAICAYMGGDANAYRNLTNFFAPITSFDLPICYRCPTSHLANVNKTFGIPILPRPDAPKGEIIKIAKEDIYKYAKGGDKVVSRYNRWLAPVILDLATHGIPVCLPDKELVENLKKTVSKRAKKYSDTKKLQDCFEKDIEKYQNRVSKILNSKITTDAYKEEMSLQEKAETVADSNSKMDNVNFVLDILKNYQQKNGITSTANFQSYLDKLLNTSPNPSCVTLSSVHKAKGLEAENVFVLNEGKVCFDPRNSSELQQQEKNLSYISLTRAKNKMYLVKESSAQNKRS